MDAAAAIGAVVGLVGGGTVGLLLGRRFRATCARGAFWAASGASVAVGVLIIFLGEVASLSLLAGAGVGLITGGLNGLRWGMGKLSDVPRKAKPQAPAAQQAPEHVPKDHTPHPVV